MYRDSTIWVGSYPDGSVKRWAFEKCPGAYLRQPGSEYKWKVESGGRAPFERAWRAHFAFKSGQPITTDGPPSAKLLASTYLVEQEIRERDAISAYSLRKESEAKRSADDSHANKFVSRG